MIPVAVERCFVPPKTLVFRIIIGQTKLACPIAPTLDPKVVVAILGQLTIAAGALQDPLSERYTGWHAMGTHLLHRHKLERIDVLSGAHQLSR